jgi:hypothetical protein
MLALAVPLARRSLYCGDGDLSLSSSAQRGSLSSHRLIGRRWPLQPRVIGPGDAGHFSHCLSPPVVMACVTALPGPQSRFGSFAAVSVDRRHLGAVTE